MVDVKKLPPLGCEGEGIGCCCFTAEENGLTVASRRWGLGPFGSEGLFVGSSTSTLTCNNEMKRRSPRDLKRAGGGGRERRPLNPFATGCCVRGGRWGGLEYGRIHNSCGNGARLRSVGWGLCSERA